MIKLRKSIFFLFIERALILMKNPVEILKNLNSSISELIRNISSGNTISDATSKKIEVLNDIYNCPVSEGTEVYVLNEQKRIYKTKCDGYAVNSKGLHILLLDEYDDMFTTWFPAEEFNKTFFLNYEDAEKTSIQTTNSKLANELGTSQPKWSKSDSVTTSENAKDYIIGKKDREIDMICDTGRFDNIIRGYCLLILDANNATENYRKYCSPIDDFLKFYSANDARTRANEEDNFNNYEG